MNIGSWQRPQQVGVVLTVVCVLLGSGVAYLGIRNENVGPAESANAAPAAAEGAGPVVAIALPASEPDLPPGPRRERFQAACTICHSTQLVLNQPPFPEKKWLEEVEKMVKTYGAPLAPNEQADVLQYLMAIRGKE